MTPYDRWKLATPPYLNDPEPNEAEEYTTEDEDDTI
jgi:hypothetical protein